MTAAIGTIVTTAVTHAAALDRFLASHLGAGARYAALLVILILVMMVISRVLKLSFSILYKLFVPAGLAAWVAGYYLRLPFLAVFSVLVGMGSAWMMFRPRG